MKKNILIVGGASGLGLELAMKYRDMGHRVHVTGTGKRKWPGVTGLDLHTLNITADTQAMFYQIESLLGCIGPVNTLVHSAGYSQEGYMDEIEPNQILRMTNLCINTPALLVRRLKNNCEAPLKVIFITSSSQYTPREREPVYCAGKAGLGMLGSCLGFDKKLGKVLVAAVQGMATPFWPEDRSVEGYLDAGWVADQVLEYSGNQFKYRFVKILRSPARVEMVEERPWQPEAA